MNKLLYILSLSLFICFKAVAQKSLSLEEAQAFAVENAYSNLIAQKEIDKSRSLVKETFAIGLPQINASGSFQHFLDIPVNVLPDFISPSVYGVLINEDLIPAGNVPEFGTVPAQFGTDYNVTGGVELQQLLFNGSYLIGLQATKAFVEVTQNQLEMNEAEIRQAVATAYYGVLVSGENERILQENLNSLAKLLEDSQAFYEEGFIEEQEVEQLQLTVSQINATLSNLKRQSTNLLDLLKMQMGMPLSENIVLSDNLDGLLNKYKSLTLAQRTLETQAHPLYKTALSNVTLNGLNVKNQKAQYWPVLSAFASHSQTAQRLEFDFFDSDGEWFPSTLWGLNLNVPIFSSGMKKNVVKQAQLDYDIANVQLLQAEEGIKMEYNNAYSNFIFSQEQLQIAKDNADLAKRIYNKTQIKYQEGIASSFELNQLQSQYLEQEANYIEAVLNFLNAKSALDKATNKYD
ncbi:MAG: TolC family protein [Bacteroidota bacterium]